MTVLSRFIFLILLTFSLSTQAQQFSWLQLAGNTIANSHSLVTDIKTDAAGNVFTVGYFQGTLVLGPDTLFSTGYHDIFVAKHTSGGQCLWARRAGGSQEDKAYTIEIGPSGDAYICGSYYPNATFGSITLTGTPNKQAPFVAKISANGTIAWAVNGFTRSGNATDNYASDLALDAVENVYLTGSFFDTLNFGGLSLSAGRSAFIAKFNSSGSPLWVQKADSVWPTEAATAVAALPNGTVCYYGRLSTSTQFPRYLSRLICLNAQGNFQWQQTLSSGTPITRVHSAALITDQHGNLICNGKFMNVLSSGTTTINSPPGIFNGFIAKYRPDGSFIWLRKSLTSASEEEGLDLAPQANGGFLQSGIFKGTTSAAGVSFTSQGADDAYWAAYDSTGTATSLISLGGTDHETGSTIHSGPGNEVYIGGNLSVAATIGSQTLPGSVAGSFFYGRLGGTMLANENPVLIESQNFGYLFPNPAATTATLLFQNPLPDLNLLQLFDISGKLVKQDQLPQGSSHYSIRVENIKPGMYYYHLSTGNKLIISGKLTVIK